MLSASALCITSSSLEATAGRIYLCRPRRPASGFPQPRGLQTFLKSLNSLRLEIIMGRAAPSLSATTFGRDEAQVGLRVYPIVDCNMANFYSKSLLN